MIDLFDLKQTSTTTLGQSGSWSNGNKEVLHILQSSRTGSSTSDDLESYQGHKLMEGLVPLEWCIQRLLQPQLTEWCFLETSLLAITLR